MADYTVAAKRAVTTLEGALLPSGSPVTPDMVDDIQALIRSGFVVSGDGAPEPVVEASRDPNFGLPPKKQVHDPALLEGKGIDELNVMVAEIDPDEDPFDDVQEAVAWLSMDFKTPQ